MLWWGKGAVMQTIGRPVGPISFNDPTHNGPILPAFEIDRERSRHCQVMIGFHLFRPRKWPEQARHSYIRSAETAIGKILAAISEQAIEPVKLYVEIRAALLRSAWPNLIHLHHDFACHWPHDVADEPMQWRGFGKECRLGQMRRFRKNLGVGKPANIYANTVIRTPLDFARAGECQPPGRILRLLICPIDNGVASLNDALAIQEDWKRGILGATALGQNDMHARWPTNLIVIHSVPIERPSRFFAVVRHPECNELWLCPGHQFRLSLCMFSRRVGIPHEILALTPELGALKLKEVRSRGARCQPQEQ